MLMWNGIGSVAMSLYILAWFIFLSLSFGAYHNTEAAIVCSDGNDATPGSKVFWNETMAMTTACMSCPNNTEGIITRACVLQEDGSSAKWDDPDITGCRNIWITTAVNKVLDSRVDEKSEMEVMTSHFNLLNSIMVRSSQRDFLYPQDLLDVVEMIKITPYSIRQKSYYSTDIADFMQGLAALVNTLLDEDSLPIWGKMDDEQTLTTTMYDIIDSMEANMQLIFTLATNSVEASGSLDSPATVYNVTDGSVDLEMWVLKPNVTLNEDLHLISFNGTSQTDLPSQVINDAANGQSVGVTKTALKTVASLLNSSNSSTNDSSKFNSEVLMVSLFGVSEYDLQNFKEPVTLTFAHLREEEIPGRGGICNFLLPDRSSIEEAWSDEGCTTIWTNATHTSCQCNHLTAFLIIMDPVDIMPELAVAHQRALTYITLGGSTLSIIACFLSITLFQFFGLRSDNVRVHQMLALSIGLSQIVFLAGVERTSDRMLCQVVAVLLHFCLTASFAWMLVEGIHLHLLLVQVFNTTGIFRKYMAFGWGCPFIVVIITICIFRHEYSDTSCWLSQLPLLTCFVPVVGLTIIVNMAVLVKTLTILISSQNTKRKIGAEKFHTIRAGVRATLILTPLLGLSWVFGFLSLHPEYTIFFTYLFTVTNSLQGLFIFVFHCLLNNELQEAFTRKRRCSAASKYTTDRPSDNSPAPNDLKANNRISNGSTNLNVDDEDDPFNFPCRRLSKFSTDTMRTTVTVMDSGNDIDGF